MGEKAYQIIKLHMDMNTSRNLTREYMEETLPDMINGKVMEGVYSERDKKYWTELVVNHRLSLEHLSRFYDICFNHIQRIVDTENRYKKASLRIDIPVGETKEGYIVFAKKK